MVSPSESDLLQPKTIAELVKILVENDIPIEKYGIGNTLPLQALLEQIVEERCMLKKHHGILVRDMLVVAVNVYYQKGHELLKLHEDRQVRLDHESRLEAKERKSRRRVDWSIAKKIKQGSNLIQKSLLAIKQELGMDIDAKRLVNPSYRISYNRSVKFPKLKNHMRVHEYDLFLKKEEYAAGGYSFQDKYLKSYFYWKEAK